MKIAIEIVLLIVVLDAAIGIPTVTASSSALPGASAINPFIIASIRRKAWMKLAIGLAAIAAIVALEVLT